MTKEKKIFFTPSATPYKNEFIKYLNDPRGWRSEGYSFISTKNLSESTILIYFKSNKDLRKMFGHIPIFETELKGLSITDSTNKKKIKVYMNEDNWHKPPTPFKANKKERTVLYRQYLTQHEMGHALLYDHPEDILQSKLCHPMQQQSKELNCEANPWISVFRKSKKKNYY